MPSRVPFNISPPRLSCPPSGGLLSPTQDPLEREEERLCRVEPGQQPASVLVEKPIEQFGGEVARILGEQRSLHPLDDVVASRENMRIDDQPHVRIDEPARIE